MTVIGRMAVAGLVAVVATVSPASATTDSPGPAAGSAPTVVVWDEYHPDQHGIHLRAARLRGTEPVGTRRIYDTEHGFTLQLAIDPAGTRVAFAPCCRAAMPTLVVVPLAGGRARAPLASHPEIYAVGGIGWSSDGRRLAFEGFSTQDGLAYRGIYSIRPGGRGLRTELAATAFTEGDVSNDSLAATPDGVLYSDGTDLLLAAAGAAPRVVLPGVQTVRSSGDGRHIVTVRDVDGRRTLWWGRPDGTEQREIGRLTPRSFLDAITPDRRGRRLLGFRPGEVTGPPDAFVTWKVGEPLSSAQPLDVPAGSGVATWN